jgi:1-acyl-sn-glycerol-3-phosphate acyltransferase
VERLRLADQLPYEFIEPKVGGFWLWVGRLYARRVLLKKQQCVWEVEAIGLDILRPLLNGGDGVLIAPNHSDHADCGVMLDIGGRVNRPFYFMAAYQIFTGHAGMARFMLPRVGAFPVDREGADLRAFKTGVEILARGKDPLVIFPEGEIYHLCDRLTPLREGAAVVATTAAKRLADRGKTVWVVPMALKYRFLDGHDPMPNLLAAMDRLESQFTWNPRTEHALVDRIYSYAEGMLGLKEMEYFGAARTGPIKGRMVALRDAILDGLEDRHCGKRRADMVPVRVKELRRVCLEKLAAATTPEQADGLRRDLNDVFVAVQLFTYPGGDLRDRPTVERVAETLMKFEQDVIGTQEPPVPAPRRAIAKFGDPIDVRERMSAHAKPRQAAGAITVELESRIRSLMDSIGPGRPYEAPARPPIVPRLDPAKMVDAAALAG